MINGVYSKLTMLFIQVKYLFKKNDFVKSQCLNEWFYVYSNPNPDKIRFF